MSLISEKESTLQSVSANERKHYLLLKRLIDIVASLVGLLLLSPVFLVVGIFIVVEDRNGPVLFKQIRVGKDGKTFFMYKFRSMVANAEELKQTLLSKNEAEGPVFKIKDDPRVTRIGKFIRKTSIDELPQLVNVLKGEMSLVGPRPPLVEEVEKYNNYEMQRLKVVPGLTCYWQISGRSNIGFSEWVELDLKYIQERNILVDLKLIFKTIFVFFGSKNAY
ncbi:sugar transferase [Niallia taxi]|uniref:sugar transferase n=1 Tax=Niallia taxi TaxID=2499688 RepID=UPI003981D9D0